MTDEGRRAGQHATWQSSEPKPISQSREKWADIEYIDDEEDPPVWGVCQAAHCEMGVAGGSADHCEVRSADGSLPCGAGPAGAARCEAFPVADQSLPRGAGSASVARCEALAVADQSLPRGAGSASAARCEALPAADRSLPCGAGVPLRRESED